LCEIRDLNTLNVKEKAFILSLGGAKKAIVEFCLQWLLTTYSLGGSIERVDILQIKHRPFSPLLALYQLAQRKLILRFPNSIMLQDVHRMEDVRPQGVVE
jgi:hypothetical protein